MDDEKYEHKLFEVWWLENGMNGFQNDSVKENAWNGWLARANYQKRIDALEKMSNEAQRLGEWG